MFCICGSSSFVKHKLKGSKLEKFLPHEHTLCGHVEGGSVLNKTTKIIKDGRNPGMLELLSLKFYLLSL